MPPRSPRIPVHSDELTVQQRKVLELIARGRTNFEIAQELELSLDGVKYHVREILAKLRVDSREDAADWWRREQRPLARLRRGVAIAITGTAVRLAAGLGAAAAVLVIGLLVVLALRGDEESPPADPEPTETAVPGGGCANIIAGAFVVPESDDDQLRCAMAMTAPAPEQRYELDLVPGLYRQSEIAAGEVRGGVTWDQPGILYEGRIPSTNDWQPIFRLRYTRSHLSPQPLRPDKPSPVFPPTAVDWLPGSGATWRDGDWDVAAWVEPSGMYQVEAYIFSQVKEARAVAPLLVSFEGGGVRQWDPDRKAVRPYDRPAWVHPAGTAIPLPAPAANGIQAVLDGDRSGFLAAVHTTPVPCIADPQPSILPAPACPDGLPQGSPVQGYLMGCVDQVGGVSAEAAAQLFETFVDGGRVYLYAVAALGRSGPRVAVLTNGERYRTIRTDNEGVTGVGSCDPQQLQDELARNDFVLNPVIPRPIP